jgi:nicotinate-nucleotide pyrophosphorylase (carboxylating)
MTDPRSLIFSRIAERTVRAAVVTDQSGVIAHIEPAAALAEELGLTVEYAVAEGKPVSAGEEVLRVSGSPLAVAHADERLVGMMAKPSGIATAAQAFVDHAAGELRIVSGAWKKLPLSQKDMIRTAITIGGAEPRIAQWPFVYLDKTFVQMLGGVGASLAAVAEHQALAQHRRVIQVTTAAEARDAAAAGADTVFVDTGRPDDVIDAATALRQTGMRDQVELAFGGGITLSDVAALRQLDLDTIDVGRAIVDAELLDMRLRLLDAP